MMLGPGVGAQLRAILDEAKGGFGSERARLASLWNNRLGEKHLPDVAIVRAAVVEEFLVTWRT